MSAGAYGTAAATQTGAAMPQVCCSCGSGSGSRAQAGCPGLPTLRAARVSSSACTQCGSFPGNNRWTVYSIL